MVNKYCNYAVVKLSLALNVEVVGNILGGFFSCQIRSSVSYRIRH
jgi:hypothetical protein